MYTLRVDSEGGWGWDKSKYNLTGMTILCKLMSNIMSLHIDFLYGFLYIWVHGSLQVIIYEVAIALAGLDTNLYNTYVEGLGQVPDT